MNDQDVKVLEEPRLSLADQFFLPQVLIGLGTTMKHMLKVLGGKDRVIQYPEERREDLPALCEALLARIAQDTGIPAPPLSPELLQQLQAHPLPGNVRELENLLHRAVALSDGDAIRPADLALPEALLADASPEPAPFDGAIVVDHLDDAPSAAAASPGSVVPELLPDDLVRYLDEVERAILVRALERQGFNRTAAGASLGLSLRQMRYRMARLGITESDAHEAS